MAWAHQKSGLTIFFDVIRNVLIGVGTGWVTVLIWRHNWILGLVAFIPVYVILLNVFGFLTLPLYRFTPENRLKARMHQAMMSGDLEKGKALTDQFVRQFGVNLPADHAEHPSN